MGIALANPLQVFRTAALALFVEHGYAATRLEDVAAAAGVSKGTLYLYFPTSGAFEFNWSGATDRPRRWDELLIAAGFTPAQTASVP